MSDRIQARQVWQVWQARLWRMWPLISLGLALFLTACERAGGGSGGSSSGSKY